MLILTYQLTNSQESDIMNAWSLLYDILNGTFDEEYPIVDKKEVDEKTGLWKEPDPVEHSDYYYDYNRNDPNAENPFTDPADRERAKNVIGNLDHDLESIARSGGFEWTPGSPWPPCDPTVDGLDYEDDYYKIEMDYEPQRNHQYKYHEEEILKDIEEYVSSTYQGHYTGSKHEFRKVQTIDLMAARDIAPHFCQANILKYGSRYGSKNGKDKKDLLKVIHYAMLLLHFDGHYGEPSMPSGNFDQMP